MKKEKKKHLQIREPVFRSCCDVIIGYTFDEARKWIHARQDPKEPLIDDFHRFSDGVAFTIKSKSGRTHEVLWFPSTKNIGVLVHETGHLAFRILTKKQIPIREENDEIFCYLQEYYFREILKKI